MTVDERMNQTYEASDGRSAGGRALYRHPAAMVGGVCAGVADYLNWDVALVRGLWVAATLLTWGAGFMAYLLLWLLLPVGTQAGGPQRPAAIQFNDRAGGRVAFVLLLLGGLWLLSNLGILPPLLHAGGALMRLFFWPLVLIGIGYLLLRGRTGDWQWPWAGQRTSGAATEFSGAAVADTAASAGSGGSAGTRMHEGWNQLRAQMPFRRSRSDRMLLGVAAGMAGWSGLDVSLVRLVWVVLILASGGAALFLYILAALLAPVEGEAGMAPAAPAPAPGWAQEVPITRGADNQAPQAPEPSQAVQTVSGGPLTGMQPLSDEIVQF